jgi:hypothetical protein
MRWRAVGVVCAALVCAAPIGPVRAQDAAPSGAAGLQYRATLYGWFPGIGGSTQFPSGAGGPSIEVDAKDVLEKLNFALMGTLEARGARWGVLADGVYAHLDAQRSGSGDFVVAGRPASGAANLALDVRTTILTLAGTYALVESDGSTFGSVFGARMLSLDQTLDWTFAASTAGLARSGSANVSTTNWDAILGFRGRARLGESRWFVPYYADIGTGQSQLTWQVLVGLGASFGPVDVFAAWRYLDYNFKSGAVQSLTFNGALAGVSISF